MPALMPPHRPQAEFDPIQAVCLVDSAEAPDRAKHGAFDGHERATCTAVTWRRMDDRAP